MTTPRIRSYPKDRDYRDDRKDEALRMMRSLKDQAGVSHGFTDHRERGPVRALPIPAFLPSDSPPLRPLSRIAWVRACAV